MDLPTPPPPATPQLLATQSGGASMVGWGPRGLGLRGGSHSPCPQGRGYGKGHSSRYLCARAASGLDLESCGERGSSWKGQGRRSQQGRPSCRMHPGSRTQSTVGTVSSKFWLAPCQTPIPNPPSFLWLPASPWPASSLAPRSFPAALPSPRPIYVFNLGIPSFCCSP